MSNTNTKDDFAASDDLGELVDLDPFMLFGILPSASDEGAFLTVSSIDLERRVIVLSK